MKKIILFSAVLSALMLSSCTKPVHYVDRFSALILNGGEIKEQNASLTRYDEKEPGKAVLTYKNVNGEDLNAYIRSATISNAGILYLLCNEPDRIIPVDALTLRKWGDLDIKDLDRPVSILSGGGNLFVANNGKEGSYISVHNALEKYETTRIIKVGREIGDIAGYHDDLYVCSADGVQSLNVRSWEKADIALKPEYGKASQISITSNGILYVSFPDFGIVAIEHGTKKVLKEFPVQNMNKDGLFEVDLEEKYLYTITANIVDGTVSSSKLIRIDTAGSRIENLQKGTDFTSLGISPNSGRLYLSDDHGHPDRNTTISIFNPDNTLLTEIEGGVGTMDYLFYYTREADQEN